MLPLQPALALHLSDAGAGWFYFRAFRLYFVFFVKENKHHKMHETIHEMHEIDVFPHTHFCYLCTLIFTPLIL
jgi:hypothetical protein